MTRRQLCRGKEANARLSEQMIERTDAQVGGQRRVAGLGLWLGGFPAGSMSEFGARGPRAPSPSAALGAQAEQ